MEKYIIEVFYKDGVFDPFGDEIRKSIEDIGIFSVKEVKVAQLYMFEGKISKKTLQKIAGEVLIDKVLQEFSFSQKNGKKKDVWAVEIRHKKGVTDTVAETTSRAVKDIGIKIPLSISTGKKYFIKGKLKKETIEIICQRILANTVVQDYFIQ